MACKYQKICTYVFKETSYICSTDDPAISQQSCISYERFEEAQKPEFQALINSRLEEMILERDSQKKD